MNAGANDESWSYRPINATYGTDEYRAWEQWLKAHNIPIQQVPIRGAWAMRDIHRNTVSVLVFAWKPEDDTAVFEADPRDCVSTVYLDKDDDGLHSLAKDPSYGVYTVQLDHKPLPFPGSKPGMQSAYAGEDNVGSR